MPTKKQTEPKIDYRTLRDELDSILESLQNGEIDIEQALSSYKRGQTIIKQLRAFLSNAENKITKLKISSKGKN